MDDDYVKASVARGKSGAGPKPGAFAAGGNQAPTNHVAERVEAGSPPLAKGPPLSMTQLELDVLTKQRGRIDADGEVVSAESTEFMAPLAASRPGVVSQEAPDSRLVAKLRGEVPQNWNASTTPMNADLRNREEQLHEKIRYNDAAPPVVPGAMAALSGLHDEAMAKQGAVSVSIAAVGKPPVELLERDEMAAAKSGQGSRSLSATPQRLQEAEQMVDMKMRDLMDDSKVSAVPKEKRDEYEGGMDKDAQALEYGEFGGPNEQGLAVAVAVEEEENDAYIPSAIQYDPDAKPPIYRNRRFRMYACLALSTLVIGTVGAVLGVLLTQDEAPPEIPYRATLGIRENIELLLDNDQVLDDLTSPYRKALDWIMYEDTVEVTPDDSNLFQRFLIAYFYFATSIKKPWDGPCSPEGGDKDSCQYDYIYTPVPLKIFSRKGARWLSGLDECTWVGIDCDESFQIRGIDLSGMNMTGTFPEGLLKLPYLQSIYLQNGELEGPLPDYLADFRHLEIFSVGYNSFTGTIPDSWLKSRNLQVMNVRGNGLTGHLTDEIADLKDLKQLALDENDFDGSIPTQIGAIPSMVQFTASQNRLNGTIPTEIGNIGHMWTIGLYRNQLTGTMPSELGLLEYVVDIRLQVNLLTGTIPEQFWSATKIWRLDLFDNAFNGTISGKIFQMKDLSLLSINDNQFSGELPPRLGSLPVLEKIIASGNNFNGTVPEQICDAIQRDQLKDLELDCAGESGAAPEISCPADCCTLCCEADGTNCFSA